MIDENAFRGSIGWIANFEVPVAGDTWRLILPRRKSTKWNRRRRNTRKKMLVRFTVRFMQSHNLSESKRDKTAYALSLMA